MNIFISAGHPMYAGAKGIVDETVIDREVVKYLDSVLRSLGHSVTVFNSEDSKDYVVETNRANQGSYDWYIDVHLNAYNGQAYGTEVLVYADNKPQAQAIAKNISSLGFYNRGVKIRTDLYILKNTKAKALLVECFFVDSRKDVDIYNKCGAKAIAIAIAEGLTGQKYNPPAPTPQPQPTDNKVFYRVVADGVTLSSYSVFDNASDEVLKQMKAGKNKIELVRVVK